MQRDFWRERWESNNINFHQQEINAYLQKYWPRLGLAPGARVFVPLCGKSRDMLWLRDQGHTVIGIELIPIAVRDFFRENDLTPEVTAQPPFERWEAPGITILCGDFFDLTPADLAGVAGVYDRAALIAFPRALRARYVARLAELLPPAAQILLLTVTYPQEQMQGPPFAVPEEEVRALYTRGFEAELLATQEALRKDAVLAQRGLKQLMAQAYHIRQR